MSSKTYPAQYVIALMLLVIASALYVPLNHHSTHGHVLSGSFEAGLPVLTIMAIPYLLLLPLFWLTILYALVRRAAYYQIVFSAITAFMISNLIYWLYPTYMPRPEHVSGLISFIYRHDRPYCDLPSEHAVMATLLALYGWRQLAKYKWLATILSVLVVASTILIQQHSLAGALAGVLLGLLSWLWIKHLLSKRP